MKTNTSVKNLIRKAHSVKAEPRVIAEFNWNRYAPRTPTNNPAESLIARDPDIYPIESIARPNRPKQGHMKAQLDHALLLSDYSPSPPAVRHHIAEIEDVYKYWSSPDPTGLTAPYTFPTNDLSTLGHGCNPSVSYGRLVNTNKIVIGVEGSTVQPTAYTIHVQNTVGGSWVQVGDETNTSLDSDGRIILYRVGSSWTETRDLTGMTQIAGVQIRVSQMSHPAVYFQLIEIAACLEKDITDWTTGLSDNFDLGDPNVLSPVGKISSNTATINLFNALVDENDYDKGLIFNQSNPDSPFFELMNENVKFTVDYIFDATDYAGSDTETIRQFTMYADAPWDADLQANVNVSLRDASKYLQETKCPETFYTTNGNMTIGEIIWRLLDNVGFLDYNIDNPDIAVPLSMAYFWVTPDKYIWDILNELAEATQTAIYFDAYGILQIKTKEAAFDDSATPVWTLRGQTVGDELEDIYQDGLTSERKDISNSITVTYKPVDYERTANDNIISQLVWEPEADVVVLRSSDISANCLIGQMDITIPSTSATDWPYSGMLQVEGEVMEYDGKEYRYIDDTDGGTTKTVKISSLSDYQKYYWKSNANNQYLNGFTGKLFLKERGMWNTYEADHKLGTYPYTVKSVKGSSTYKTLYGYYYAKKKTKAALRTNTATGFYDKSSYLRLQTTTIFATDQYLYATRGSTAGDAPNFYGTSFRIPGASQKNYYGGLVINAAGTNNSGYHIEVRPTAYTTTGTKEIIVYMKTPTGTTVRLNGKGWRANIVKNVYYSLDVQFSRGDSSLDGGYGNATHYIWVWLNGRLLGRASVTGSNRRLNSDNFGMFLRGSSAMDYEYLYAYERKEVTDDQFWGDDVSFYDRVINGYVSNQSLDEFTSKTRRARRRTKTKSTWFTQRYDTKFFDEFGPVVHEMRKFDVKFEGKLPGLAPKLIVTNESEAKYLDFRATAFGAEFYAVNSSHDDTNIHGTLDEVDQQMAVAMQSLIQTEGDVVTVEDAESIRVNGKKELEISSDWIQTKEHATALGEWIKNHWDATTDEISVTIFGNPLLELTDVVAVDDPQSQRSNVKYFVIGISSDWDNGLQTTVRLRKVRV